MTDHDRQRRPPIDTDKLMAFVFRAVDEVGATLNAALVVMGDRLGYYRALAGGGPDDAAAALAERTETGEHYAREWLNAQAAGGYRRLRPGDRTLHAAARAGRRPHRREPARPSCPASSRSRSAPSATPPHHRGGPQRRRLRLARAQPDVHDGCERFFRPGYDANLVAEWLPALDGVVDKLTRGRPRRRHRLRARRVDRPAWRRPSRTRRFVGSDYHQRLDRRPPASAPAQAGVGDRVRVRGRAGARPSAAPATTW